MFMVQYLFFVCLIFFSRARRDDVGCANKHGGSLERDLAAIAATTATTTATTATDLPQLGIVAQMKARMKRAAETDTTVSKPAITQPGQGSKVADALDSLRIITGDEITITPCAGAKGWAKKMCEHRKGQCKGWCCKCESKAFHTGGGDPVETEFDGFCVPEEAGFPSAAFPISEMVLSSGPCENWWESTGDVNVPSKNGWDSNDYIQASWKKYMKASGQEQREMRKEDMTCKETTLMQC